MVMIVLQDRVAFVRMAANLYVVLQVTFSLSASPCSANVIRSAMYRARLSEVLVAWSGSGACGP